MYAFKKELTQAVHGDEIASLINCIAGSIKKKSSSAKNHANNSVCMCVCVCAQTIYWFESKEKINPPK